MKRILLAALAATGLSATALAQSSPSGVTVGTPTPSTGQVGSSNLDVGSGTLSPVSPNTTDMDAPGSALSGSMGRTTGLDLRTEPSPSSISPGQLTPPSTLGLPDLGTPQPSVGDTSGVNTGLSPTVTPDVNR